MNSVAGRFTADMEPAWEPCRNTATRTRSDIDSADVASPELARLELTNDQVVGRREMYAAADNGAPTDLGDVNSYNWQYRPGKAV